MPSSPKNQPALPLALSVGLVLLVVAVALVPNTGVVAATSNCQYSSCSTTTSGGTPVLWYAALGLLLLVAVALAVVLVLRRRRSTGAGPVEPWTGTDAGAAALDAPTGGEVEPPLMPGEAPAVPPGAGAAYLEGPDDVGAAPVTPAVPPPAPATGGEADIDSLMQELDKISGEILKRGSPKKPPADTDSEEESGDGNG